MPIYEYKCKDCGKEFEELLLGRDKEPEVCPSCKSANIGRKISNTSFSLKGKGWYVTDYGGYNPGAVPASESRSDGAPDTGSSDSNTSSESSSSTDSSSSSSSSGGCGSGGCGCSHH